MVKFSQQDNKNDHFPRTKRWRTKTKIDSLIKFIANVVIHQYK